MSRGGYRAGLGLCLLVGCSFGGSPPGGLGADAADGLPDAADVDAAPPAERWFGDYQFRKRITITPVDLGADLVDFPVGIELEGDSDLAQADLGDSDEITFTADDGDTLLAFEIESFDEETGDLAAWVEVDLPVAGTAVYLYFDNPGVAATEDRDATWSGPFASVWHLSQDPEDSEPQFDDSIGGNDGEASGSGLPAQVDGVHGPALDFDGADDELTVGDPGDDSLDFGEESFSYSVWVNVTSSAGQFDFPMWKGGTAQVNPGYAFVLGTGDWNASVADGVQAASNRAVAGQENEFLGRWVHLVAVVDQVNEQLRVYADGSERDVTDISAAGSLSTDRGMTVSQSFARFLGSVDEMRVYDAALTEDWIKTEFHNLMTAGFLAIEDLESRP